MRHEAFDFRVLQTPHFDIYYYPAEEEAVRYAGRLAERWYERLSRTLDHTFRERQPIVLYASHTHFRQTTVIPGLIGESVEGVTEHGRGRVVMPFAAGLGETDHVLGHELVHAFQRDILDRIGRPMAMLPLWFLEGMAEHLSVGRLDSNTAMWLRDAAADPGLPRVEELDAPEWFPYRYGHALWAYLADRFGDDIVARSLKSRAGGGALGRIQSAAGVHASTLSEGWHAWLRERIGAVTPAESDRAGTAVVARRKGGGRLNVAPALSPDGRELVFLSERDRYSIDVYLADASTGAIKRRLVRTAADAHFDSLQFVTSAGAWHPSGGRFALAGVQRGRPVISIIDTRTGDIEREIVLEELDAVYSPAWSPDARQVALSGLRGGLSDLYVLDMESERLEALTTDAFADLQPAWSPDGRTIAFATDRFSSSPEALTFGLYRIGTIDVLTGEVLEAAGLTGATHVNPQWSTDGAELYFVADAGRRHVYRVDRRTGELFRVTDAAMDVSGLTPLSPALSLASGTSRLAFSVYRRGAYELHVMDAAVGTPVSQADCVERDACGTHGTPRAALPSPAHDVSFDDEGFRIAPYRGRLSLDRIGQPYLSAGGGSIGGFVRAGVSVSFGDMLGQHAVHSAVQVGSRAEDFGVRAAYINRQSRWNWGIRGERVPAALGASRTTTRTEPLDARAVVRLEQVKLRQVHRRITGVAMYPFSSVGRLELSAAWHRVGFASETTITEHGTDGSLLFEDRVATDRTAPLTLMQTAAAVVHDTSLMGPAGPVMGRRYRFEIAPTTGDLSFATVLADYRRYLMPVRPFTLALRLQHVGRYGPDAGDIRLLPLATNVRGTVRGHSARGLLASACGAQDGADCSLRHYLSIRQVGLANVEWRFPLLGVLRREPRYGPLPMEGFAFVDSGWFRSGTADLGGTRWHARQSAGAGIRLSAAGFLVELAGARPFGAHGRGWTFVANFRPAF